MKKEKDVVLETNTNEFEDWSEKKNKKLIIGLIVLIVIILLFVGYYVYFYVFMGTEKYLDKVSNNITTSIGKVFDELESFEQSDEVDLLDTRLKGSINVDQENKNLFGMEFDFIDSPTKLLMSVDAKVKQSGNDIFGANLFFQDDKVYLNSKDIFNGLLEASMVDDLITSEESVDDLNYSLLTNMPDLEYYLTKILEYHIEALKEGKLSTKPVGLTEKQYVIQMSASEKIKANEKLVDLVTSDKKLNSIIERYEIENYNYLMTGEFSLTVGIFDNEIKSFIISTSDYDLSGEYDGEKYVIKDESNDYMYLWITDKEIKFEIYENNVLSGTLSLIGSDKEVGISFDYDGDSIEAKIIEKDETNGTLTFKLLSKESDLDLEFNADIKIPDESTISLSGKGTIKVDSDTFNISLDMETLMKENQIERIDASKAKKIEDLTEEEQETLFVNLYNLLEKLGLTEALENMDPTL